MKVYRLSRDTPYLKFYIVAAVYEDMLRGLRLYMAKLGKVVSITNNDHELTIVIEPRTDLAWVPDAVWKLKYTTVPFEYGRVFA